MVLILVDRGNGTSRHNYPACLPDERQTELQESQLCYILGDQDDIEGEYVCIPYVVNWETKTVLKVNMFVHTVCVTLGDKR